MLGTAQDPPIEPDSAPEIDEWACRADSLQQVVGQDVVFNVSGPGAVASALWQVDGEEVGAILPLTHRFDDPGGKQISVEIETDQGTVATASCSVDIVESSSALDLIADFAWSPSAVFVGQDVRFSDVSSGGPASWSWTFDRGNPPTATGPNPTVRFDTAGAHGRDADGVPVGYDRLDATYGHGQGRSQLADPR